MDEISRDTGVPVEEEVTVAGGQTATVQVVVDDEFRDRVQWINEGATGGPDGSPVDVDVMAERAASLLADIIGEEEYDEALFCAIFEQQGAKALGAVAARVFTPIREGDFQDAALEFQAN